MASSALFTITSRTAKKRSVRYKIPPCALLLNLHIAVAPVPVTINPSVEPLTLGASVLYLIITPVATWLWISVPPAVTEIVPSLAIIVPPAAWL
jgi:hypothetical protein